MTQHDGRTVDQLLDELVYRQERGDYGPETEALREEINRRRMASDTGRAEHEE
jgi:uncharacterized protein YheU (UPF0270 family)